MMASSRAVSAPLMRIQFLWAGATAYIISDERVTKDSDLAWGGAPAWGSISDPGQAVDTKRLQQMHDLTIGVLGRERKAKQRRSTAPGAIRVQNLRIDQPDLTPEELAYAQRRRAVAM